MKRRPQASRLDRWFPLLLPASIALNAALIFLLLAAFDHLRAVANLPATF